MKARVSWISNETIHFVFNRTSRSLFPLYSSPVSISKTLSLLRVANEYHVASIYTENAKDFVLSGLKIINALA
jgi:hypothetical protein